METKKYLLCVLIFILLTSCARVPWTKTDRILFLTACGANAYDYQTTSRAIDKGHGIRNEWSWLYGHSAYPSDAGLATSKIAQLIILWAILDRTPSEWRKVIIPVMTGGWLWYGYNNY